MHPDVPEKNHQLNLELNKGVRNKTKKRKKNYKICCQGSILEVFKKAQGKMDDKILS
jgi:hypothetical protein